MFFLNLSFSDRVFEAVFAMNCLLHLPRPRLKEGLRGIRELLAPGGIFYWGQYGGVDREGVRADDHYRPKRFFSTLTDAGMIGAGEEFFEVIAFEAIPVGDDEYHFQSLTLRAGTEPRKV
jgi:SAM-dependent methyltransferase